MGAGELGRRLGAHVVGLFSRDCGDCSQATPVPARSSLRRMDISVTIAAGRPLARRGARSAGQQAGPRPSIMRDGFRARGGGGPYLEGRGSGGLVCKRRPCVRRLPIHVLRVGLADRWWPARGLTFVRPWRPVQDIAYGWPKGRIAAHVGFDGRLVSRLRPIRSRLPDVVLMGESIRPTDAHACSLGTIAGWIGRILQRLAARLVERVRVIFHSWIGLPSGEASVGALTHVTERQPDRGQCRARARSYPVDGRARRGRARACITPIRPLTIAEARWVRRTLSGGSRMAEARRLRAVGGRSRVFDSFFPLGQCRIGARPWTRVERQRRKVRGRRSDDWPAPVRLPRPNRDLHIPGCPAPRWPASVCASESARRAPPFRPAPKPITEMPRHVNLS